MFLFVGLFVLFFATFLPSRFRDLCRRGGRESVRVRGDGGFKEIDTKGQIPV